MDYARFAPAVICISGGAYNWQKIKKELADAAGWVSAGKTKGLHTSCKIERVKEHSQWLRFREKKSTMIPFSAIELSVGVNLGSLTKEDAILEMANHMGFATIPPKEYDYVYDYIGKDK